MIIGIILNIILNGMNRQKDSRYHDFWGEYPDSFRLINSYATASTPNNREQV
jgi:hypothetical protein